MELSWAPQLELESDTALIVRFFNANLNPETKNDDNPRSKSIPSPDQNPFQAPTSSLSKSPEVDSS